MITITLKCRHCGSDNLVRDGRTANGKPRYWCKDCNRSSRDHPQPNGYAEAERERLLNAYQERSSLRGLERTFGVSRQTVSAWLKKRRGAARLERHPGRADDARGGRVGTR